jgi:hypothetical protein
MNGEGVVSVRLPRSLLEAFRALAERQRISIHEAARRFISRLPSLTQDELKSLKEPPNEADTPRISLYLGWDLIDMLTEAALGSRLTNSSVLRRLLYGFLVRQEIEFVQQGEHWELKFVSQRNGTSRELET